MGSMVTDAASVPGPAETHASKTDSHFLHEGSEDVASNMTSPDAGAEPEVIPQDVVQTQKRKGGRKPIYATSEERKQRNRQAQAAFRERRTEYIKQLETTIKRHEENLQSLQQSHRSAADECLMLRYKNSLLERILLEKGIDVQAELQHKGASPHLGPTKAATSQASQMQRAAMNRQQQTRRLPAGLAPKLEQPIQPASSMSREGVFGMQSPQLQPTPSSHASSPATVRSPGYHLQGEMTPPGTGYHSQAQQTPSSTHLPQLLPQQHRQAQQQQYGQHSSPGSNSTSAASQTGLNGGQTQSGTALQPSFYQSYQKQYGTIDSEFDAQNDMPDDSPHADTSSNLQTGGYASGFGSMSQPLSYQPQQQQQQPARSNTNPTSNYTSGGSGVQQQQQQQQQQTQQQSQNFDAYDPLMDADPFGLSASMHFQTPFNYEQGHGRH